MQTLASRKIIDASYPNIRPLQEDFDNFISMPHFQVLTLEIKGCKNLLLRKLKIASSKRLHLYKGG
jgi:hypothetical protein